MTPWWDEQIAGTIGGFVGVGVGGWGSLVGGTLWFLIRSRLGIRIAIIGACLSIAIGFPAFIAGVYALTDGQPYYVWYTLGYPGLMMTAFSIAIIIFAPKLAARYDRQRLDAEAFRSEMSTI